MTSRVLDNKNGKLTRLLKSLFLRWWNEKLMDTR